MSGHRGALARSIVRMAAAWLSVPVVDCSVAACRSSAKSDGKAIRTQHVPGSTAEIGAQYIRKLTSTNILTLTGTPSRIDGLNFQVRIVLTAFSSSPSPRGLTT